MRTAQTGLFRSIWVNSVPGAKRLGERSFYLLWCVWCGWMVPTRKHPRMHAFTYERLKPCCFGVFGWIMCSFAQNVSESAFFHMLWCPWCICMVPMQKHPRIHAFTCERLKPGCFRAFGLIQYSFMQNGSGSALFHLLWWLWCTWMVPTRKHPRMHAFTCGRLKPGCFRVFGLIQCAFMQNGSGSALFHLLWWVWCTWMVPRENIQECLCLHANGSNRAVSERFG